MDVPEFNQPPKSASALKDALALEQAEPPAEPTAKPEPDPTPQPKPEQGKGYNDIEIPTEIKGKKAADHFRAATTAKRKAEEKAEELSKMLDERQAKYDAELQELKDQLSGISSERDNLQDTLKSIDIERDPQFQEAYNKQEAQVANALSSAVGPDAAKELLSTAKLPPSPERDAKLAELTSELNQVQAARVGAALAKVDELSVQRASEIENSRQNWDQLQAKRQEEVAKQQEAANNVFKTTLGNASKVLEVFQDEADSKSISEAATAIFAGSNEIEDVARAAVWAAAAPKYRSLYSQAQKQIADLQTELATLKGAEPGVGGDGGGSSGGSPASAVDAFSAALNQG